MEICFRHQFSLVVADFNREHFLNYIHTFHDADPDDLTFLGLKLIGPFDLFVSRNVFVSGRMSPALTVQRGSLVADFDGA